MTDGPDKYRPRRALPPEPEDDFLDEDLDVTRRREDFDPADLDEAWRPRRSRFAADPAPEPPPTQPELPAGSIPADEPVPSDPTGQSGPPTFEQPAVQDTFQPDPYGQAGYQDPYGQDGQQQPGAAGIAAGLNDEYGRNVGYREPAAAYEDPSAPQDETRPARSSTIWSAPETSAPETSAVDHPAVDHSASDHFGEPDDQTHVARSGGAVPAPVAPLEIPGAQSLQPGPAAEEASHETVFRSYTPAASAPDGSAASGPYRPRRSRDDDSGWGSTDDAERKPAKLPLIMVVAAALAIIIGVVFTVVQVRGDTAADPAGNPSDPASNPQSAGPAGVLTEESMLSEESAADLDGKRSWQIASTDNGRSEDSALPLCVSAPTEGQPAPESTLIRTLTASGGENVAALHQADAYPTPDEAAQAYTLIAGSLGGCAVDNAYITSAVTGKSLGNQASGVVVQIGSGEAEYHTVLVSRTGRVVNVLDVARTGKKPASIDRAGKALATVTNQQCSRVAGVCATGATLQPAPPPVGGDQPGYLNSTDFPVIAKASGTWEGTEPTNKVDPATSSQCEGVKFSSAENLQSEGQVTYLMRDEPSVAATFGIDEIVLTMKDEKAASALAKKVSDNIKGCEKKQLTAKVSKGQAVEGTGAKSAKVRGYAYTVAFELDKSTVTYRVGISSVGNKVIYTFLPTDKNFDFTDEQWTDLNVRAGMRASQTK